MIKLNTLKLSTKSWDGKKVFIRGYNDQGWITGNIEGEDVVFSQCINPSEVYVNTCTISGIKEKRLDSEEALKLLKDLGVQDSAFSYVS